MHYHHHILIVLSENCYPFTEKKHPSRCHSYEKKKNETKLSVIWRKQIKSMKKQQLTFNPYHPKLDEGQQQLKLFVSVLKKSKTCLKEVKNLVENGDTPDDAIGYMASIRRL